MREMNTVESFVRKLQAANGKTQAIEPLDGWILVYRQEVPETNPNSKIILPDITRERYKPMKGIVMAIGAGAWRTDGSGRIPMPVKEGDLIIFRQHSGDRVGQQVGLDECIVMMRPEDIMGRVIVKEAS